MLVERAKSVAGFTMIEMIVTMTIFAVLVAVGVPTMRVWISNNKIRAVSDSLQNGLRLAKVESLRNSRQVVFALTNSTTPTFVPLPAAANGLSWAIYALPSMTDNTEGPTFIESGVLSNASANVAMNSNGVAAICFNSVGRMVANATASVIAVTGGATCSLPAGAPAVQQYGISLAGADRPLQVNVGLGGQVHLCDPNVTLSATHPEGC